MQAARQAVLLGCLSKKRQADRSQSGGGGGATAGRGVGGGDQFRFVWMAGAWPPKAVGRPQK